MLREKSVMKSNQIIKKQAQELPPIAMNARRSSVLSPSATRLARTNRPKALVSDFQVESRVSNQSASELANQSHQEFDISIQKIALGNQLVDDFSIQEL
jgi:hypothetical protein